MEKILLTRSGYEKLVRELDLLSRVERPQLVQELLEAAQEGGRRTPISSPPWSSGSAWIGGFSSCSRPWPTPRSWWGVTCPLIG